MAETIISQLDRAFANPLETNRQVNFISDRDAISALRRWEGMQVYVKSELTTYELRGGILNEHWTDISGVDSANYTPTGGYEGTAQDIVDSIQTVTGGIENISITHIANLDYYVIANPYKIGSEYYTAAPTTVTLTDGDATYARIDVIYADVNGVIGVLEGTPSASPIKEVVDLPTQRELTFRTVPALATVDPLVNNELVFDENTGIAGGEWDVTGDGLTYLDFDSTAVAFSGTKSIYFNGVNPYFYVDFESDVNISLASISTFYFRVYLTEIIDRNAEMVFQLQDTSFNIAGSARVVKDGLFGLDRNVLNAWQIISIPIGFFNYPYAEFKGIRFSVSKSRKPKMYMDTLQFQFNVAQPPPTVNPLRFLQLTDTPTTYSGQSLKVARVNVGETALEFDELTKSDVGLSNVDNTSDANKPVSTAQQTALNLKQATLVSGANIKTINGESLLGSTNIVVNVAALIDDVAPTVVNGGFWIEPDTAKLSVGVNNAWVEVGRDGIDSADGAAGVGDMVLANTQTVSGLKTFLNGTFGLRNIANTFTALFSNINTAIRTYTFPDKDGTVAMTSDITGINSGTNTGDQTIPTTLPPTDGSVTRAKLDAEQKSRIVLSTDNIDWSLGKEFTKTLTANWTITETNLPTGTDTDCIIIYVTGAFTITPPAYWKKHGTGAYDGTKVNMYVIDCLNGTSASEDVKYAIIPAV